MLMRPSPASTAPQSCDRGSARQRRGVMPPRAFLFLDDLTTAERIGSILSRLGALGPLSGKPRVRELSLAPVVGAPRVVGRWSAQRHLWAPRTVSLSAASKRTCEFALVVDKRRGSTSYVTAHGRALAFSHLGAHLFGRQTASSGFRGSGGGQRRARRVSGTQRAQGTFRCRGARKFRRGTRRETAPCRGTSEKLNARSSRLRDGR